MPHFIHTETDLQAGVAALIEIDPRMRAVFEVAGHPPLRKRAGGFPGLAAIVVSQQVSVASAAAIWGRLAGAFDPLDHDTVRRARADRLARLGLSAPKIRTLKAIGNAIASGALNLEALAMHGADEAHAALTAVHGIGPWTADVYLLFCLGHADAFPAGDLALQEAMKVAFNLKMRPSTKEAIALAEGWRPWRGAAACLLWTYYRAVKGRSGAPIAASAAKPMATAAKKTRPKNPKAKKPHAKKPKAKNTRSK
jgi:DNA-3-methyladenine glycosylase II